MAVSSFVGTPSTIADQMEEWLTTNGCDGFNIMFPSCRRAWMTSSTVWFQNSNVGGIFRKEYEGRTLRENLGLPRPANRFFDGAGSQQMQPNNYPRNLDFGAFGGRWRANAARPVWARSGFLRHLRF